MHPDSFDSDVFDNMIPPRPDYPSENVLLLRSLALLGMVGKDAQVSQHLIRRTSDPEILAILTSFAYGNSRIQLVKNIRIVTGWGLKESKEWMDRNIPRG